MRLTSKKKHIIFATTVFTLYSVGGMLFYTGVEKWSVIDAFYFTLTTFTTIGYGDIAPVTSAGKLFTIFFSFFGIAVFLYLLTLFGKYFYKKVIKQEMYRSRQNIKDDIEEGKIKVAKVKKVKAPIKKTLRNKVYSFGV